MTNNNTKTILTFSLAAVAVSLVAGSTIAYADFSGDYDPANWTLTTNGGDGSVDTFGAPGTIVLTGSDSNTEPGDNIDTDYTVELIPNVAQPSTLIGAIHRLTVHLMTVHFIF